LRSIGNGELFGVFGAEMGGTKLNHLACPDKENFDFGEVFKQSDWPDELLAAAMLMEWAPISVVVRTSLATEKERWNN
jgi:hypothetical protein